MSDILSQGVIMKKIVFIILGIFLTLNVWAAPAQIIIIRHGEKIDDSHRDLSPKGCQRAYLLTDFFKKFKSVAGVYAQGIKKAGGSIRSLETIAPTAKTLGIKINNLFLKDDLAALAHQILTSPSFQGKTVLISWEHSAILNLVPALGIKLPENLNHWPSTVFDQAWIISYTDNDAKKGSLEIMAEHVLPTDISNEQSGVANWGSEINPANNGLIVPEEIVTTCAHGNQGLDEIVKDMVLGPFITSL